MLGFALGLILGGIAVYWTLAHEIRTLTQQLRVARNYKTLSPLQSMSGDPNVTQLVHQLNNLLIEYADVIQLNQDMLQQLRLMTTSIAHDFRTPLTSMLGYVQLVIENTTNPTDLKRLSLVESRIKDLNRQVEDFYLLSQISSQDLSIKQSETNITRLLQEHIASYFDTLQSKFESVTFNISDTPIIQEIDPIAFQRILNNLTKNALDHGIGNFSITLSESTITFTNNTSDAIDTLRIFERTYRHAPAKRSSTGLGLSIAKQLAEAMGMTLTAKQEDDTIHFILTLTKVSSPRL